MENIKRYITELCDIMTVSGFEYRQKERIINLGKDIFDEVSTDNIGNYLFLKKSKRKNAPRLLIDTHIDQIGMIVTEICKDGFVKFTSIGGLDSHILQGAEVVLYGEKEIFGVITSTPPHLQSAENKNTLEKPEQLYIDTGYSEKLLKKIIPIGTPISFKGNCTSLFNGVLCGPALDNKASCGTALHAISSVDAEEMAFDVYLLFSAREEHGAFVGAWTGAALSKPDIAISLDANFARTPNVSELESVKMGEGFSVSISCVTSRKYTKKTIALAKEATLPYQLVAEPNNVGTNANVLGLTNFGIPCIDLGLPLGSMHTFSETVSLCDCKALSDLLCLFIRNEELATEVQNERKN